MIFEIHNDRTNVLNAEPFFVDVLNAELRYPIKSMERYVNDGDIVEPSLPQVGWDGWCRLVRKPKFMAPWFPSGLLARAVRLADKFRVEYGFDDQRIRPEPSDIPALDVEIPLRDYQQEAVDRAVQVGFGVLDMPPRSGKTRTAIAIVRRLTQPTIWLAPTDRIVRQTVEAINSFFGPGYAYHLEGTAGRDIALGKNIVVCTAATAVRLKRPFYASRECLIVDEWHHGASVSYKKIMRCCGHIFHRYGMTGTFFRSGSDELAMHALLANTVYKMTSSELLDLGHLVPVHVAFLPVLGKKLRLDHSIPRWETFNGGHGKFGIMEHAYRNQLCAHAAYVLAHKGYRVLVLVCTKKQGYLIKDTIEALLPPVKLGKKLNRVEFISTDLHRGRQGDVIDSFNERGQVQILIGTTILGEGVDLPVADALVLARGQQAEVSLTQAMYRICTAAEGKRQAVLVDFADRHNKKLEKHSLERLQTYYKEPTFQVEVLPSPAVFPQWLAKREKGV